MQASRTWTDISGTITDFAKYVVLGFPEGILHRGDRERILSFLVAFPIVLKRELRNERDLRELKTVLAESDLARLQNADSMSAYCLYVLSGYMLKARRREHEFPQTFIVVRFYSFFNRLLLWTISSNVVWWNMNRSAIILPESCLPQYFLWITATHSMDREFGFCSRCL